MRKRERKAATRAFRAALERHDDASRLAALERRVKKLKQWPEHLLKALQRLELQTVEKP